MKKNAIIFILCTFLILSCLDNSSTTNPAETRSFYMGFTTWPYALAAAAVDDVFSKVKDSSYGDITALHYMNGVPWTTADTDLYHPEDLDTVYSAPIKNDINERLIATAPSKVLYIAVDSINSTRSGINKTFGGGDPGIPFNSANAEKAFVNYAVYLLYEVFTYYTANGYVLPEIYFNYGSEATDLIVKGFNSGDGTFDLTQWNNFVDFSGYIYGSLNNYSLPYPGAQVDDDVAFTAFMNSAKLMVSVALKSPEDATAGNIVSGTTLIDPSEKIRLLFADMLSYIDIVGVSTYGYIFYDSQYGGTNPDTFRGDPSQLPADWLSQINSIAPGKPAAITETGWISEDYDVLMNGTYVIQSNTDRQNAYMSKMLADADALNMEFVIMFTIADYFPLWNTFDAPTQLASLTWLTTGLFEVAPASGSGPFTLTPKPAWTTWQNWLVKSKN
ncbi:MAG: hypothetical protein JW982_08750 [Spirochaetes bacterium]|nr:hypothetical protein [Spirochaetota bacterium]